MNTFPGYYDLKNLNVPEIEHYDVLKDDFIVDYTYFHLRKNSVLLESLNEFLMRVTESGLHVYWETESYFARNLLLSHARLKDNVDNIRRALTINKLKGHFLIWGVGMCISILRFGYELVLYKFLHSNSVST